ncbi:MAG: acetolactate synthase small subunit [Actinomycetia bacterium]|nr:acetolactate synthase small subunit [Actinomycetes bacterium]
MARDLPLPRHTLSLIVENRPGVLARVSSTLARRGFNIHSLAVGPTIDPGLSRITVVVESEKVEQVKKQLHKLINVVKIFELEPSKAVERETMLIRISAMGTSRTEAIEVANIFKANVVDVGFNTLTFEVTGKPAKLNDLIELLRPFGVVELVKSGRIAIGRAAKSKPSRMRAVG